MTNETQVDSSPTREESCVFCEIVAGRIHAGVITETKTDLAIISLEGDPLVMSKKHITAEDVKQGKYLADATRTASLALRLAGTIQTTYQAEAINLFTALGRAAGQEVNHLHMHLIPRIPGDKKIRVISPSRPSLEERRSLADLVRANLPLNQEK